jgi:hypothetical protein
MVRLNSSLSPCKADAGAALIGLGSVLVGCCDDVGGWGKCSDMREDSAFCATVSSRDVGEMDASGTTPGVQATWDTWRVQRGSGRQMFVDGPLPAGAIVMQECGTARSRSSIGKWRRQPSARSAVELSTTHADKSTG